MLLLFFIQEAFSSVSSINVHQDMYYDTYNILGTAKAQD